MNDAPLTIADVSRATGLSAHVIRAWEKRYGVVVPVRTGTNRRLYSREHVERLTLLAQLTRFGRSISTIAGAPTEALRKLLAEQQRPALADPVAGGDPAAALLAAALEAVRGFDTTTLEGVLTRAELALGAQGMLQRMAAPLAHEMGERWRQGALTAAHEHFATAVLRAFLSRAIQASAHAGRAPVIVVVTPPNQLHELGALLASAAAAHLGWRVMYLGPNLPAAEIAIAARQHGARVVALSLVYPEDDSALPAELVRLRELLPRDTAIVVGGRARAAYHATLVKISAQEATDLGQFGTVLDTLRRPGSLPA